MSRFPRFVQQIRETGALPLPPALRVIGYRLPLLAAATLPTPLAYGLARKFGRVRYHWYKRGIERQRQSLNGALGARPELVEDWLNQSFQLQASEDLESLLFSFARPGRIAELIEVRGQQNLDTALAAGRGAILYSGHVLGQRTFLAALGLLGYRPNFVRLRFEDQLPSIRRWLYSQSYERLARKFDCRSIRMQHWRQDRSRADAKPWMREHRKSGEKRSGQRDAGASPRARDAILNALARNEVVVILIDMAFTNRTAEAEFFGRTQRFPTGPAELARESGALLLDFFIHRDERWIPQIAEIGTPIQVSAGVEAAVQSCANRLEERIRRHPASWAGWHTLAASG